MKRWMRGVMISWLALSLAACGIEGGTLDATSSPAPTNPQATPTAPEDPTTRWVLGLTEEPLDLFPYNYTARSAAALIELLYPAPLHVVDETYAATYVLERVPSFENGDVAYVTTTVYLDDVGAITTTETTVVTSVRQLAITYRWNAELAWSDGEPLTAEDSVFAYELFRTGNPNPQLALARELTYDYVALDAHTTRAYLPPGRDDPNYLQTVWRPLPSHRFDDSATAESVREALSQEPISYGDYALSEWQRGFKLVFDRTAAAPTELPEHLHVELYGTLELLHQAVVSGTVDIATSELLPEDFGAQLAADDAAGRLNYLTNDLPVWEHIDYNLAIPALQDLRMRQAIAYAFDRAGAAEGLYGTDDAVWDSWIAPQSWAYADEGLTVYRHDPVAARELLDAMGYADIDGDGVREDPTGQPFALRLVTSSDTPVRQAISARFVADLAAVGVKIELETRDTQELYSQEGPLFRRTFELVLFGWLRDIDPAGGVLWACTAIPNEINNWTGNNFTGWCMDTADTAIRQAIDAESQEERAAAYREHQQILTRELPILPVLARQALTLTKPAVSGLAPQPFAPITWNLRDWKR